MTWVYIPTDSGQLMTVGFYDPTGGWHSDSDWDTREEAASRCHYLNGGNPEAAEVEGKDLGEESLQEVKHKLPTRPRPKITIKEAALKTARRK
jgi:hypothetical protein